MTAPIEILGSFHYLRRMDLTAVIGAVGRPVDFFADSGAFSAASIGAQITVPDYAAWLRDHADVINAAATLDVIGDHRATARNTGQLLERVGDLVQIVPAFHVNTPWPELHAICADGHPYVALGGAVGYHQRTDALMRWCIRAHRVARDHDTRLHGFGLTRPPYPVRLPWYSVDSAYWESAARTGGLSLWDGRRMVGCRVGTRTVLRRSDVIRSYGGDPALMSRPGFGRVGVVGHRGRIDREWLSAASVRSLLRYRDHVRRVRGPVGPPRSGPTSGDGLKVYLAATSRRAFEQIADATREEHQLCPVT